ncbi:hypothetical protein Ana3638_24020 [Anaerocolumna sedimenticola]|uniref:Uncharacterized protein n=1 Tax=Anaerocolumna sedimenticola TaxID=2696063 RepID=A0A6P1TSK1_9FIRM|nr:helix-turn-helix transcriptional regulator [Anaerocolumna sedimenticola]QHQ63463.1 hypothetical protein Ana3638_24020 [Anaerocolumna sedimenticola]
MDDKVNNFNKKEFANLINKAKGSRTMTKFAEDAGLSVAHISRMINMKLEVPPTPDTIRKLVDREMNGVTYEDLMIASGYISAPAFEQLSIEAHEIETDGRQLTYVLPRSASDEPYSIAAERRSTENWEIERVQMREERDKFYSMCVSLIMSRMNFCPFDWRIDRQSSNRRDYLRDFNISLLNAPVETWDFEFKYFRSRFDDNDELDYRRFSPMYAFSTWGRLATMDIPNDYKYTIVTSSKGFFYSLTKRSPKNLDINISVILIDIDNFKILSEEYVCYNHTADIEELEKLRLAGNDDI